MKLNIQLFGGRGASSSYMMYHRPTEGGRLWDISEAVDKEEYGEGPGSFMPSDVYEHPEWYFNMNDVGVRDSVNKLRQYRNISPDTEVTIYRAQPKGKGLNNGDWVTISKEYAQHHLDSQLDGKGEVVSFKVKAKDVAFAGDDVREFGYFGRKLRRK